MGLSRLFSRYKSLCIRKHLFSNSTEFLFGYHSGNDLLMQRQMVQFLIRSHRPQMKICSCNAVVRLHFLCQRHAHTAKGWKSIAKPKENPDEDPISDACEEGTGAISHDDLMSHLQNCNSVQDQIDTLCATLSLTPEDIINRKNFCNSLTELCKPYFPPYRINLFGSSINGLGFKGCDVDACIVMENHSDGKEPEYIAMSEIPSLDDILSYRIPKSTVARLYPKLLLRFIRRIMRQDCEDVNERIFLIKARCPLLRFYNTKYDLFCDFSCENRSALQNTRLLRFIGSLDARVLLLVKTLRYWGKRRGFVGDIEKFNSYAFSLLVVYFLQNTSPPVLPPINDMLSNAEYLQFGDITDDEMLLNSVKNIPPSQNKQTTEELLKEFFFFYLYYDFSRVMLPLTSSSVPAHEFKSDEDPPTDVFEAGTVCLQDPFRRNFNSTSGVTHRNCKNFLDNLIEACKCYQDETIWTPNTNYWGISSLFIPSASNLLRKKRAGIPNAELQIFQINLKPKMLEQLSQNCDDTQSAQKVWLDKASQLVVDILEYGLLFKCTKVKKLETRPRMEQQESNNLLTDSNLNEDGNNLRNCTGKTLVKLQCEAVHNTCVGRHRIKRENYSDTIIDNPLELEHLISKALSHKNSNRKNVLFSFECECQELQQNDKTSLLVTFTIPPSKFQPVVTIFLKQHVPKMVESLL